jgi:hypothetical protein
MEIINDEQMDAWVARLVPINARGDLIEIQFRKLQPMPVLDASHPQRYAPVMPSADEVSAGLSGLITGQSFDKPPVEMAQEAGSGMHLMAIQRDPVLNEF